MNYDPTGRIPTQHNERGNDMPSPTPEELFTDAHNRYMKNWAVIISLRQFVDASAAYAEVVLAAGHVGFMELFATDPDYMNIFGPGDKPVSAEPRAFMEAQLTQGVMTSAHAAIDAQYA
jgi:hypothetical protein